MPKKDMAQRFASARTGRRDPRQPGQVTLPPIAPRASAAPAGTGAAPTPVDSAPVMLDARPTATRTRPTPLRAPAPLGGAAVSSSRVIIDYSYLRGDLLRIVVLTACMLLLLIVLNLLLNH